jgi:hypothetical protein
MIIDLTSLSFDVLHKRKKNEIWSESDEGYGRMSVQYDDQWVSGRKAGLSPDSKEN